ncbi:MAG: hypothetical protein Q8P92_03825 [Candidatus Daviesbacteria bacterium]|nr:hypothetical protein [Candidatus Daviesbacteria bacterium]
MSEILDQANIKIYLKMSGNYLAQATLIWDDAQVRYFRVSLSKEGNLWLQPPSTGQGDFGHKWFRCFIVDDKDKWHKLQERVINQFLSELDQKVREGVYSSEILNKLKNRNTTEEITDEDLDQIDKAINT